MAYGKKQRRSIKDKIDMLCGITNSSLSTMIGPMHLEMNGNSEAIVEGCKSIVEYDENIIKISTKKMFIAFFGRNLTIKCLTTDRIYNVR